MTLPSRLAGYTTSTGPVIVGTTISQAVDGDGTSTDFVALILITNTVADAGTLLTVSSITGGGLTWAKRQAVSVTGVSYYNGAVLHTAGATGTELWWAHCPGPLTSATFVLQMSGTVLPDQNALVTVAYTNCATPAAPWDGDASLPATLATLDLTSTINFTTAQADDLLLAQVTAGTAPSGYTEANLLAGSSGGIPYPDPLVGLYQAPALTAGAHAYAYAYAEGSTNEGLVIIDALHGVTDADPDPEPEGVYPDTPMVFLSWSDDRGHSYGNPVGISLGAIGEYVTSLQWQRLGVGRSRVFQLEWSSPVRTVLLGAWLDRTPAQT